MSVFNFIGKTAFNYNSVSGVIFKNSDGRANLHISKIVKDIIFEIRQVLETTVSNVSRKVPALGLLCNLPYLGKKLTLSTKYHIWAWFR